MVSVPREAPPWAQRLADDISREMQTRARGFPVVLAQYSKTDLPDPARWAGAWIYVHDATGGAVPAFSDGSDWRRSDSSAVIS